MTQAISPSVTPVGIKGLVGRKVSQRVKFLDTEVSISKLNVSAVLEIQARSKAMQANTEDENAGMDVLRAVVRAGVEGGADLTDADFNTFPLDELTRLSNEILKFSGVGTAADKAEADAGK